MTNLFRNSTFEIIKNLAEVAEMTLALQRL